MTARVVAPFVVLLLLLSGISGCDRSDVSPERGDQADSTAQVERADPIARVERADPAERVRPNRYARKYMPFDPVWVSERKIPIGPQRSPQMVIWEVSEFDPRIPATQAQQEAGDEFVKRCFDIALAKGWFDRSKAMADGFLTPGSDSRHHRNDEYILDEIQLDPERPEYLMYYPDPNREGEQTLTGFMFLAAGREARGTQFAGPLAVWHFHKYTNARCWAGKGLLSTGMIDDQGKCPTGSVPRNRSPEMVHVWLIDHPRGPFSTGMTLPSAVLKAGLAKRRETLGY